jgi:putative chitinase
MYSQITLKAIMPFASAVNINKYLDGLNKTAQRYQINTPERLRMFIAQLAHESGSLNYVRELASGDAYDTGRLAKALGNTPEKDGDGRKYKGRGLIQITGTANYRALSQAFKVDFLNQPELLETPEWATLSAGWFWNMRKLNVLADKNDLIGVTKRINGGLNGLEDRRAFWERAKKVII